MNCRSGVALAVLALVAACGGNEAGMDGAGETAIAELCGDGGSGLGLVDVGDHFAGLGGSDDGMSRSS